MAAIIITPPVYAVGDLQPVEQVAGAGALADRLRSYGFDLCSVSDKPPSELAGAAIAALLHKLDVSADSVDAVVYGTCSHRGEPDGAVTVPAMLDRLGLASVPFVGVWLGESGNLVGAVRLARGLLRSGMRTVLIVVTDAVPQRHGEFRAMGTAPTSVDSWG